MIKQSLTVESIDTATQKIFWACRRCICKTAWISTAVSARGTQPVEEVHHETNAAARKRRTTCARRPSRRLHALENASRLQDPFRSSSFSPSPNSTALNTARGGGRYRLREEENKGWRRWDAILSSGFRLAAGTASVWFRRWKEAAGCFVSPVDSFFSGCVTFRVEQQRRQTQQKKMTIFYQGRVCVCDATEMQVCCFSQFLFYSVMLSLTHHISSIIIHRLVTL